MIEPRPSHRHHPFPADGRSWVLAVRLTVLLVIAIAGSSLHAQTQLPITGAVHFSESDIRDMINGRSADSARLLVQTAYASDGYLDASVTIDSLRGVVIGEGSRYAFDQVKIAPDSIAATLARGRFAAGELTGEYFSPALLADYTLRIVRLLNDLGYPLASARVTRLDIDSARRVVGVALAVSDGGRVVITGIDVQGNTQTHESLIRTAAAIPPNSIFTDDLARGVHSRLQRLNLFSEVGEPQLYRIDSVRYGLLLTVKEGNTNNFDGIIGYQPADDSSGAGNFTGLVNVEFRNLFGTGRRVALRWQRRTASASQLELRYREPFILGIPLDLEVSYNQDQQETTPVLVSYVERAARADFYYGLTDAFSIRLGGALEATIPQNDSTADCSRKLLNSSTLESTFGIVYDTRSSTVNPVSGVRYSTTVSIGAKRISGPAPCDSGVPASDTRRRYEVDIDNYIPIARSFVLLTGVHGGELQGNILEESDLFRFGGQGNVRGYREDLIHASRRAWGTLETRLLLSSTSYAALFIDGGYYRRMEDALRGIPAAAAWLLGYGAGIQIETPLGLVRISYALSRDDTFGTGKVFVGLVNQF
ncbi:MAG: outer membrane protein [Chlorobi bacterium]|nr:outer membrane protein [Chlorobiota bacterium]